MCSSDQRDSSEGIALSISQLPRFILSRAFGTRIASIVDMKKIPFTPSPAWIRVAFGAVLSLLLVSGMSHPVQMFAQSNVSGDIAGTVTDPSGKAVVGATVTVKSQATDATKVVTSGSNGSYRVSLLSPGQYSVTVTAPGFETSAATASVGIGQINTQDFQLAVGSSATTIEVTGTEVPLLHTENADISTTFDMQQVQSLPNPGNDLTFVAQTAPGVVMNTQGGYGNFSAFGLPATSNTFTVNGGYENDPFLNVNNSGATNLLLGNNDVSDVSVVSNAYQVQYGGLGAAQINETTRSGSNKFHGNASYWWNGRTMNANSYFHKQFDEPRNFDNVNQYAAAVGGPIYKDHSFFFVNYEGLRVILPSSGFVGIPNAAFQSSVLGADGNCDDPATSSLAANGNQAECGLYKTMFGLYNTAAAGKAVVPVGAADPNANQFLGTASNFTHEWLLSGRIDQSLRDKDHIFGHFKIDKGLQATYTDLLTPLFNADSPQPQYEGQLNETHTFSPNVVNQFIFAAIYYRAIFTNTNQAAANALVPFNIYGWFDGSFYNMGGLNALWPQGRNVTGYQFIDDFSVNRGKHTFKAGFSFRRDDVTDYGPSELTTPLVETSQETFATGNADFFEQAFPLRPTQPVSLYTEGFYGQDQWKAKSNLNVTAGIRIEHNSNPVCHNDCYARLAGPLGSISGDTTAPLNSLIQSGQYKAFSNFQTIAVEPRVGFSYSPFGADSKTVIRGGYGLFADSFPAQIADSLLNNTPTNNIIPAFGGLIQPNLPGSNAAAAAQTNANVEALFASGGSSTQIGQVSVYTPAHKIFYPMYSEWSLQVEQQLPYQTVLSVAYVGNSGYHEPVVDNNANAYNDPEVSGINYAGLPTAPANANFSTVTNVYSGANSNYNGLILGVVNRSKYLTLQFNYAYSHALDDISNGGFNSLGGAGTTTIQAPLNPATLLSNYGNADYDARHNFTGSYVFNLPYKGGPHVLTDGWEFAGTVFHNTGFPFSVVDSGTSGTLSTENYGGAVLADQLSYHGLPHQCGKSSVQQGAVLPSCFAPTDFAPATGVDQGRRNNFYGPGYTDTDFSALKSFRIPGWESAKFTVGAQFFNLFNHPNFAKPDPNIASGTFGTIQGTVNPPTSILGSFLGGDASPRLIQFKGNFTF
jgi:hypothetical protein